MQNKSQRLFLIIFTAIAVLAALSICPWSKWTGGRLKDINLLGDVMPHASVANEVVADNIDPELEAFAANLSPDTVKNENVVEADSIILAPLDNFKAPTKDGVVLIEDYSREGNGLSRLSSTLGQATDRKVRIAMVGDSYIEGDILAQDIRSSLQDTYGGSGVGYVGAFSNFPGFRQSVIQTSDGWDEFEIRKMKDDPLRTILGHYHVSKQPTSLVKYKGSTKIAHASSWDNTTVLFVAPQSGTITFTGNDNMSESYPVEASTGLQGVTLSATSSNISISSDIPGIKVLGIWLEGNTGIVLDDISLRGNSGISHRRLNESTTATMRQWIDYDVIILEFGMNALSASQTDYTAYGAGMVDVVNNLKRLYPHAQILIMGVADRGTKMGTEYVSMATLPAMIRAQRDVARKTGSLFYDTRAAMGGEGSSIDWHRRKLINSDFVHLNHKGGKELAGIFLQSLSQSLQ